MPTTDARVDQASVLPKPAKTGSVCEFPFQDRRRINANTMIRIWSLTFDCKRQSLQLPSDDLMVVTPQCIARNPRSVIRLRIGLIVVKACGNNRANAWEQLVQIGSLSDRSGKISHRSPERGIEPIPEVIDRIGCLRAAKSNLAESQGEARAPYEFLFHCLTKAHSTSSSHRSPPDEGARTQISQVAEALRLPVLARFRS